MRSIVKNYLEAAQARREEKGDEGFSLIELIVAVVILGVLAAIAIPIFLNVQQDARDNALAAVAGNAATQVTASMAATAGQAAAEVNLSNLQDDDITVVATSDGDDIDTVCATATRDNGDAATAGPGCP